MNKALYLFYAFLFVAAAANAQSQNLYLHSALPPDAGSDKVNESGPNGSNKRIAAKNNDVLDLMPIFAKKRKMIAHHVLFWLKADISADQKNAFRKGLESLEKIEVVKTFHIGTPAPIERSVVDTSYTFSLILFFDDLAAHDIYQVHPIHKAFLDEFRVLFEKVVIYDAH